MDSDTRHVRCPQCGHDEALLGQPCARCGELVQDPLDYRAKAYLRLFYRAVGTTSVLVLALLLLGWHTTALVVGVLGGLVIVIALMAIANVGLQAGLGEATGSEDVASKRGESDR